MRLVAILIVLAKVLIFCNGKPPRDKPHWREALTMCGKPTNVFTVYIEDDRNSQKHCCKCHPHLLQVGECDFGVPNTTRCSPPVAHEAKHDVTIPPTETIRITSPVMQDRTISCDNAIKVKEVSTARDKDYPGTTDAKVTAESPQPNGRLVKESNSAVETISYPGIFGVGVAAGIFVLILKWLFRAARECTFLWPKAVHTDTSKHGGGNDSRLPDEPLLQVHVDATNELHGGMSGGNDDKRPCFRRQSSKVCPLEAGPQ